MTLQLRKTYDQTYFNHFIKTCLQSYKNVSEQEVIELFSMHVLTVNMAQLGKDILTSLTTGRFHNNSPFRNKINSKLPKFLYECFIHIYDKDGYIRDNHSDIAALRQILMMYYKFVVPFTRDQELDAHTKFIETDDLIKISEYPNNSIRNHISSCLPDDPWDIRPRHSNGATNTLGVNNATKRSIERLDVKLSGMFSKYFRSPTLVSNKDATFNSKLTVVPKDSRGPRTICMEPHERMFIQKGIMHKIYEYIETSSVARGYINFSDQSINKKFAYQASLDGKYATIDLKDASDMVPWPLIQEFFPDEWVQALDVTRATHTNTLHGPKKLNKFAPMGSALCFPIEAIVFWSIARSVCDEVYVYGDDIIVPTHRAQYVMSALESYGLVINRDKSLTTGFFKESCGGDYFHGHDIGIIQCKSLDLVSFVDFANLISRKFENQDLGEILIKKFEEYQSVYIPRSSTDYNLTGVFNSPAVISNDVFLRRRYNKDLQIFEYRILTSDTVSLKALDLTDNDLYHDWLVSSSTSAQSFDEHIMYRSYDQFLNRNRSTFFDIAFDSGIKLVKKRDKLKFTWLPSYYLNNY